MKKDIDIHGYDKKFESALLNLQASKISERNKKQLKNFTTFALLMA